LIVSVASCGFIDQFVNHNPRWIAGHEVKPYLWPSMKLRQIYFHWLWILWILCAHAPAFPGTELDNAKIKTLYQDGEFEKVREELEDFLKQGNAEASREDRITAYKYLGVIYGSKPGGKPQSETYFFRLFDLAPRVNLNELYVSSSIDQIFRETRERFVAEKLSSSSVDEFGNPKVLADSKSSVQHQTKPRQKVTEKPIKVWPWVLGAAVIGGGISVYFLTSGAPSERQNTLEASF
jgi:hypothetical protein